MSVDYFAEVNLAGFYDVAASLGGVEVCLNLAVPTTTPAPTCLPVTKPWTPSRPWRSSASAMASTTVISIALTVSRRSWCR